FACPHYFPAGKVLSMNTFHLQRVEEAFRTGIIVTTASGAHPAPKIMPFQ
ncbi:putative inner membrane protein, partial [Salmonella enterica subsp. enterica serovar Enteritidis str. CVM_76-3618]